MQTFTTIIREAREESVRLDIEVCGGRKPRKASRRVQIQQERELRIESYRSQTVWEGEKHDGSYQPPAGGFQYAINEPQQAKFEIAFCSLMVKVGIMSEEDFE